MFPLVFQSSPGSEAGCNDPDADPDGDGIPFQSSPGSEAGCNTRRVLSCRPCNGSNPHPARKPGATQPRSFRFAPTFSTFQSSPGSEAGCNATTRIRTTTASRSNPHPARKPGATTLPLPPQHLGVVPILTRLGSRVQPLECMSFIYRFSEGFCAGPACAVAVVGVVRWDGAPVTRFCRAFVVARTSGGFRHRSGFARWGFSVRSA